MSPELAAILLIIVVHIIGGGALIWALVREDGLDWRSWWPDDDEGGGRDDSSGGSWPGGGPGGVPLPDARQSRQRLRGPDRVGIGRRRARPRPEHQPERVPQSPAPTRRARA